MATPEQTLRPAPLTGGILDWAGTTDHKRLGVRIGAVALAFFLISGLFALVMRFELAAPGLQLVSADVYNQLFSMHGSGMIYLVITPIALAMGVYLVPLQVGAAEIAAPRLALAGHWLIVAGGLTMFSSFATQDGGGKAGWTAYYPLSGPEAIQGTGMDLWTIGVIVATAGAIVLAATILATIIRHRAPEMTLLRMPVFTWTMLVTCLMVLMALPVLLVAMGLLLAERVGADVLGGADAPIIFQNLFWFYGHPVVYVMFFPFLGAAAEVIATFSGRRLFGYRAMVAALLFFAAGSMSVWAHHMFTTGAVPNGYFSVTSTLLLVPAGVEYFDAAGTLRGGRIRLRVPMLFALGFFIQFLVGGLSGIITAAPVLDYHVHDSYFIVAHFHYTLFAGSLFGLFAAIYYWLPKVTGRMISERAGKLHFWLMVVGANVTFFPMFMLGWEGMPRRVADYLASEGFAGLNLIATIGAFTIAASIAVFLYALARSLRDGPPAGPDPWEANTLEWATTSPPPRHNFDRLPPIRSEAPLLDLREEAEAMAANVGSGSGAAANPPGEASR
ncbi:MAG: cytochrome c oxidase subunit I [Solirubrobacterales bacterium]